MSPHTKRSFDGPVKPSKKQKVKQSLTLRVSPPAATASDDSVSQSPPLSKYKLKKAKQAEADRIARESGEDVKETKKVKDIWGRDTTLVKSFSLFDDEDSPLANINNYRELPSSHDNPYDLQNDLKFQRQLRLIQIGNAHLSQMAHPNFSAEYNDINNDDEHCNSKINLNLNNCPLGEAQRFISSKQSGEFDQDSDDGNTSSNSQSSTHSDLLDLDLDMDLDLDLDFDSNMGYLNIDKNSSPFSSIPDNDKFSMAIPLNAVTDFEKNKIDDTTLPFDSILGSLDHLPGTESLKTKIPKLNLSSGKQNKFGSISTTSNDVDNNLISSSSSFNMLNFNNSSNRAARGKSSKGNYKFAQQLPTTHIPTDESKDNTPLMMSEFIDIEHHQQHPQTTQNNMSTTPSIANTFSPRSKHSFEYRHNNKTLNLALTKEPQLAQRGCKQALKRLAIWSGKAQEMVYDGSLSFDEFIL